MIADFINNYLRPEVKSLILQYTLSCPLGHDIKSIRERRKYLKYIWFKNRYDAANNTNSKSSFSLWIFNPKGDNFEDRWKRLLEENADGSIRSYN